MCRDGLLVCRGTCNLPAEHLPVPLGSLAPVFLLLEEGLCVLTQQEWLYSQEG